MENNEYSSIQKYIADTEMLYIKKIGGDCKKEFTLDEGRLDFFSLYRIDEVTFEDKAPRKEALENVITSMDMAGVNFVYIILGNSHGVSFYYGVARDFAAPNKNVIEINDIGSYILKPSLQGNFRGSKISELSPNEKREFLTKLNKLKKGKIIEGVPGINKDDEDFQSVDRIIDVMLGNEFAFVLIAKPIGKNSIQEMQSKICELYDMMNYMAKYNEQKSKGTSQNRGTNKSNSSSKTVGDSKTTQISDGTNLSDSESKDISEGKTTSESKAKTESGNSSQTTISGGEETSKRNSKSSSRSKTHSETTSSTDTKSTATTETNACSEQRGESEGAAISHEIIQKRIQLWLKYLEDMIIPRVDYGMGKGLFSSIAVIFGNNEADLIKLQNTIRSIYGGESGNEMPLRAFDLKSKEKSYVDKFQIPSLSIKNTFNNVERMVRTSCCQKVESENEIILGSWMSSKELSLFAGLPQKEVAGLALREEVEFGLNVTKKVEDPVMLGYLVQSGVVLNGEKGSPKIEVNFDRQYFDKHIFVTGVTGSGKTTTCQKLLLESKENFMVIEPAKTEYRVLSERYPDLLVFTLGKESAAPFRLNPFEFFPGESITSRVDMLKASMESAFDMEAAIPQILEAAIYKCYQKKGWNISNNRNALYENPFSGKVQAFPTLHDLELTVDEVVMEQGFDDRLKNDYIGSIKARLQGLVVGAKGMMLNTPRSIDFVDLLDKKVVLELENIKSGSEKSLIMGFILANVSEAIKYKYAKDGKQLKHIMLVEEAHRLLSKFMPGDSMNKKQGVEMFSDMLAEVRKYGESLIIADQIPDKLTPEVLKNTNTKFVHKIFAQDDKEAIGNTMALKDEQKDYLSYLGTGCAIMINPGLDKAIQLQVAQTEDNDTSRNPPTDKALRKRILKYYADTYDKGVIPGLELCTNKPKVEWLDKYIENYSMVLELFSEYKEYMKTHCIKVPFIDKIKYLLDVDVTIDQLGYSITMNCYRNNSKEEKKMILEAVRNLIMEIIKEGDSYKLGENIDVDLLESCN